MSRFKRFAHSLVSGYVLLGANTIYTLLSIPLALAYLSRPQFGLWSLVTTVSTYLALVDLGMSGAVARILIDYKDNPEGGRYGSVIKTASLVGAVQGAIIILVGFLLAILLQPLLHVPRGLEQPFLWLMIGQSVLVAISFTFRIFSLVLTAHQRYDVVNYAQAGLFAVNYAVLWLLFAHGFGVFSILWAQAVATCFAVVLNGFGCLRLGLFPAHGQWGRVSWHEFKELFAFGRDIFLFVLGSQLVTASQGLLLTRFFGLDAAAVWTVCTRAFMVLLQVIYRIFDYSSAALAEMIVRGERELVTTRFRQIISLSASLSIVVGILFALCNTPFVQVWTAGKVSWQPINDLLLAVWLVICVSLHAHVGLVGQTKKFKFLRYVFFIEGLVFVGANIAFHRFGGITLMLIMSICCSLCLSFAYGLYRTRKYFALTWHQFAQWHREAGKLLLWLLPLGILTWWFTRPFDPLGKLLLRCLLVGIPAAWLFLRHGLGQQLKTEMTQRLPSWMAGVFTRVCGPRPRTSL